MSILVELRKLETDKVVMEMVSSIVKVESVNVFVVHGPRIQTSQQNDPTCQDATMDLAQTTKAQSQLHQRKPSTQPQLHQRKL